MKVFSSHKQGLALILCFIVIGATAHAQTTTVDVNAETLLIDLQPPQEGTYIQDHANLLDDETVNNINAVVKPLFTESKIPIFVVTINSMADHNGKRMRIETFANILFDEWGIGFKELGNTSWNRGILFLVSKNDRKARIELGADWTHQFDRQCQQIMNRKIVPNFKQNNYPKGILEGVKGLEEMTQAFLNPTPPPAPEPVVVTLTPSTPPPPRHHSNKPVPAEVMQILNLDHQVNHNSSFSHHNQTGSSIATLFPIFFIGVLVLGVISAITGGGSSGRRRRNLFDDDDDHFHNSHSSFSSSSSFSSGGSSHSSSGSRSGGHSGGGGATGSW